MQSTQPTWFEHCMECAARRRRYAHFYFRLGRAFKLPATIEKGKSSLREAIGWIQAAKKVPYE